MRNLWLPARAALSPQGVAGNGYAFTIEKEVARPARLLFSMLHFLWRAAATKAATALIPAFRAKGFQRNSGAAA